jgi:hypothetical protein
MLQQPMVTPLILDGALVSGPSSPYIMEGVAPQYCVDAPLETDNPPAHTYILNNNVVLGHAEAELVPANKEMRFSGDFSSLDPNQLAEPQYEPVIKTFHAGSKRNYKDKLQGRSQQLMPHAAESSVVTSPSAENKTTTENAAAESDAQAQNAARQKIRRRRRNDMRGIRLAILSYKKAVVECELECSRQKRVTFKFDIEDANFKEIAQNFVIFKLLKMEGAFTLLFLHCDLE